MFPCDWDAIGKKPDKNLADGSFLPETARTSGPVPVPVKEPAKNEKPKDNFADFDLERAKHTMPPEELCLGEMPVDTTEIDQLLSEMDDNPEDSKSKQILRTISAVNDVLDRNIKALQAPSPVGDGAVSREELLKLLRGFAEYSKAIEKYVENLNREKTPSSLC